MNVPVQDAVGQRATDRTIGPNLGQQVVFRFAPAAFRAARGSSPARRPARRPARPAGRWLPPQLAAGVQLRRLGWPGRWVFLAAGPGRTRSGHRRRRAGLGTHCWITW